MGLRKPVLFAMATLIAVTAFLGRQARGEGAAPSPGSPSSSASAMQREFELAVMALKAAEGRAENTRLKSEVLARHIAQLKDRRDLGDFSVDGELGRLLRRSVDAEEAVRRSRVDEATARKEVERHAVALAQSLKNEIEREKPALERGPLPERRAAARRIMALRAMRTQLAGTIDRLATSEAHGATQGTPPVFVVAIDPLDGPGELDEKADWVEFTRRKLLDKLAEIRAKAQEAETELALEQDFLAFRTDTDHFDESMRAERILRGTSASPTSPADDQAKDPRETAGNRTSETSPPLAIPQTGDPAPAIDLTGPESFGARDTTPSQGGETPPRTAGAGPSSEAATTTPSSVPGSTSLYSPGRIMKELTPDVVLRLDPTAIGRNLDPAELRRLVEALVKLDRKLALQASELRSRARRLEKEEDQRRAAP